MYAEYSPPGCNLLIFPCQVEEKSETIRCLEDDLLRELEEKLLERSQIMDPGVMAELERELELANSEADVSLACAHTYCFYGFYISLTMVVQSVVDLARPIPRKAFGSTSLSRCHVSIHLCHTRGWGHVTAVRFWGGTEKWPL